MSISEDLKYIGFQVDELEIQNARLQGLVDSLTEQLENQAVDEKVIRFLDLIQPDIEMKERLFRRLRHEHRILNDQRLIDLISAYRAIRPK